MVVLLVVMPQAYRQGETVLLVVEAVDQGWFPLEQQGQPGGRQV